MVRFFRSLGWAMLASSAGLALLGCGGPDYESLCNEQEDCVGGNSKDREACVAEFDMMENRASIQGCSDEYDAYVECFADQASCKNKNFDLTDPKDCEAERNAYKHCDQLGNDVGIND